MLSADHLFDVTEAVVTSFDIEFSRTLDLNRRNVIFNKFNELYYQTNLFTFFTHVSLVEFATNVFSSPVLRDFVLNLTERVSIIVSADEFQKLEGNLEGLTNTIAMAVCRNKFKQQYTFIPSQIADTINTDSDTIVKVLKANFWIVVLYLLIVYFNRTETFRVFGASQKKG